MGDHHARGAIALRRAHGFYGFPTLELVDFLRTRIAGRSAIEIGAGPSVLAQALGIPATDNHQQEDQTIRALGQPTVPYGDHVQKLDAAAAPDISTPGRHCMLD